MGFFDSFKSGAKDVFKGYDKVKLNDKITYDEDGYVFNMNEIKGYVKLPIYHGNALDRTVFTQLVKNILLCLPFNCIACLFFRY